MSRATFLKTFTTHTLALVKDVKALELAFNVWSTEPENEFVEILRCDYQVVARTNQNGTPYEELVMFVWYLK